MHLITDYNEMLRWHQLACDQLDQPFEYIAGREFSEFSATGYSSMFTSKVIKACCRFYYDKIETQIGAFFSRPDPSDFFLTAGYYGGLQFSPQDDPEDIEKLLFEDQAGSALFSIYESSHRMFILPSDKRWALIGDRDADLVFFCFRSRADKNNFFLGSEGIETFDDLENASKYANSFMGYFLDIRNISSGDA